MAVANNVPFDLNGFLLNNMFLPSEMLLEIFQMFDTATLLNCQRVCRYWDKIIHNYLWRQRAEIVFQINDLPFIEHSPNNVYYKMSQMTFNRNLIKNHSGEHRLRSWVTFDLDFTCWYTENPPSDVAALPDDPVFEGKTHCFISRDPYKIKYQDVDLSLEGYSAEFIDNLQPPIVVSAYYCNKHWYSHYLIEVYLCDGETRVLHSFEFDTIRVENNDMAVDNNWHLVTHVFRNYGRGVRTVRFSDSGYFKCKIAGASVKVLPPEQLPENFDEYFV